MTLSQGPDPNDTPEISQFTHNEVVNRLSHELGSPIAALRGYVSLWLDGTLDPMPWSSTDEIKLLSKLLDDLAQSARVLVESFAREPGEVRQASLDGWPVDAVATLAGRVGHLRRWLQRKDRSLLRTIPVDSQNAAMACERSAIILEALVTQLATAHTVSGDEPPEMTVIDLTTWLRQSIHALAPAVTCFGHSLALDSASESASIQGNSSLLSVALLNLLDNAQKFSPERAPIQVIGFAKAGACGFAVEDSGPGLPHSFEFRAFGRIDEGPGFAAPGVGLGLFTARRIAELHGGSLTIRTIERLGTSVRIQIPTMGADSNGG